MKHGWEIKKLGDITTSINGLWTGKKPPLITIAVIRNTNFTKDCKLDTSDIAYIDVEQKQYASRKLQYGDIIIEKSGGSDKQPVGRPILFNIKEGEYSFSNFTSTLRVNDKTNITPEFLHRYLAYIYMRGSTAAMQSKTTGIRNLDFTLFKSIQVPVPSMEEQERIVAELDCLSGVIEKKREQLKELDRLAQSIFYEMFGDPITNEKHWQIKKLGEVCSSDLGKTLDSKKNKGNLYNYLCSINVQWGYFDLTTIKEMRFEESELERYSVKKGDLLICEGGDTGRCAIWNSDDIMYYQNALHRVRFENNTLLSIFFQFVMLYLKTNGEIDKYSKGQTIKHLVKSSLMSIPTPVPPLAIQQEFAKKIEAIEAQKELIKQSIAECEQLFNSRMQYYFN